MALVGHTLSMPVDALGHHDSRSETKESAGSQVGPVSARQSVPGVGSDTPRRESIGNRRSSLPTPRRGSKSTDADTPRSGGLRSKPKVLSNFEIWNRTQAKQAQQAAASNAPAAASKGSGNVVGELARRPAGDAAGGSGAGAGGAGGPKEDVRSSAYKLSKKHELEFFEVKHMLEIIHQYFVERNSTAVLTMDEFADILVKIFEGAYVERLIAVEAYMESLAHDRRSINADKFMQWYKKSMFTHVANIRSQADMKRHVDSQLVHRLAKHHDVSEVAMEKIKRAFDNYDTDNSGYIDYKEFSSMMLDLLKVSDKSDLSENRLKKFWYEIDSDGSGQVDFKEYFEWYIKYFMGGGGLGLVDSFYASHMPSSIRAAPDD